jgi:hypothetical protein
MTKVESRVAEAGFNLLHPPQVSLIMWLLHGPADC